MTEKEVYIPKCKWCNKKMIKKHSFVVLTSGGIACHNCYRLSGASLPFLNKLQINSFFLSI
jgi:hypothetical protein